MPTADHHDRIDLPERILLEGIVTTVNANGSPNIAPLGPIVDQRFERLLLRPYQTSDTFRNLQRTGEGVLHVTDDVELLARAAVDQLQSLPQLIPAEQVDGFILADACRWYAFRVETLDASCPRSEITARVVAHGRLRDFFGFNRAKHAVVEAAILATRLDFLPAEEVLAEYQRLARPIEKTAGQQERRAFDFLQNYVEQALATKSCRGELADG